MLYKKSSEVLQRQSYAIGHSSKMLAAAVPDIEAFVASEAGKQLCAGFNQSVPDTVAQVSQS